MWLKARASNGVEFFGLHMLAPRCTSFGYTLLILAASKGMSQAGRGCKLSEAQRGCFRFPEWQVCKAVLDRDDFVGLSLGIESHFVDCSTCQIMSAMRRQRPG